MEGTHRGCTVADHRPVCPDLMWRAWNSMFSRATPARLQKSDLFAPSTDDPSCNRVDHRKFPHPYAGPQRYRNSVSAPGCSVQVTSKPRPTQTVRFWTSGAPKSWEATGAAMLAANIKPANFRNIVIAPLLSGWSRVTASFPSTSAPQALCAVRQVQRLVSGVAADELPIPIFFDSSFDEHDSITPDCEDIVVTFAKLDSKPGLGQSNTLPRLCQAIRSKMI